RVRARRPVAWSPLRLSPRARSALDPTRYPAREALRPRPRSPRRGVGSDPPLHGRQGADAGGDARLYLLAPGGVVEVGAGAGEEADETGQRVFSHGERMQAGTELGERALRRGAVRTDAVVGVGDARAARDRLELPAGRPEQIAFVVLELDAHRRVDGGDAGDPR